MRITIIAVCVMLLLAIPVVPVFAQGGGKTVMKCDMSHDIGQFQSHTRAVKFPLDGVSCKCFYYHGQGDYRFYAQSKSPSELNLQSCTEFCRSKVGVAKEKGASVNLIKYCGQAVNWK